MFIATPTQKILRQETISCCLPSYPVVQTSSYQSRAEVVSLDDLVPLGSRSFFHPKFSPFNQPSTNVGPQVDGVVKVWLVMSISASIPLGSRSIVTVFH